MPLTLSRHANIKCMPDDPEDIAAGGPDEADGTDVSLIRWMLSLSPPERLDVLQQQVNAILEVRERNAGGL